MKKIVSLLLLLVIGSTTYGQSLEFLWKTDTLLRVPESVLFNKDVLYVSCIGDGAPGDKDGNGYIAKVSTTGQILKNHWIIGLDAPKGLGLYKNLLYVADLTNVVVIDIVQEKIIATLPVEGAEFLNDVTVDKSGTAYISDSATGKIYAVKNNQVSLYFESQEFNRINGLLALSDGLRVVDFANGNFFNITAKKDLVKVAVTAEGADGIIETQKNEFIITCWPGEIHLLKADKSVKQLLNTREQQINAADAGYDSKTRTLYVPTFFKNGVTAYRFNP